MLSVELAARKDNVVIAGFEPLQEAHTLRGDFAAAIRFPISCTTSSTSGGQGTL